MIKSHNELLRCSLLIVSCQMTNRKELKNSKLRKVFFFSPPPLYPWDVSYTFVSTLSCTSSLGKTLETIWSCFRRMCHQMTIGYLNTARLSKFLSQKLWERRDRIAFQPGHLRCHNRDDFKLNWFQSLVNWDYYNKIILGGLKLSSLKLKSVHWCYSLFSFRCMKSSSMMIKFVIYSPVCHYGYSTSQM